MPIELVMPSNHLILCHPLLLLNIARKMMTRLKVFAGEAAPGMIAAQKPTEITL